MNQCESDIFGFDDEDDEDMELAMRATGYRPPQKTIREQEIDMAIEQALAYEQETPKA